MEILLKYFPDLTQDQQEKFAKLGPLYAEWNEKINVISRKDIDHLYERHVLHSLAIAKLIDLSHCVNVLDVGTGGGFPGIPLAIMYPEVQFHLVDSIGKKIKVVEAVVDGVGLENVTFAHVRAEDVNEKFDMVVTRAVTKIGPLHRWVNRKIRKTTSHREPHGVIYLKGGDLEEEIKESALVCNEYYLSNVFKEEFFATKELVFVQV